MSERSSLSSTKYGPSVSDAVRIHDALALPGVIVSDEPSSSRPAVSAEQAKIDCETTIVAAALAARPSICRRLIVMFSRHARRQIPGRPLRIQFLMGHVGSRRTNPWSNCARQIDDA